MTTTTTADRYCTFRIGAFHFGVDVGRVQEVIRHQAMTRIPLAPPAIRGLINLRGQIVTAVDLRRVLGLPDRADDTLPMNVVVTFDDAAASLLVDEIDDVVTVPPDSCEPPPNNLAPALRQLLQAVHKLPGRLLLALDVDQVLHAVGRPPRHRNGPSDPRTEPTLPSRDRP
ncbi:MAG: purine-binding chemotaxis protein CheW [Planctomycetes bacterium]|nr:purine-binding chemotaxis protein CheW [Planctomycetota bacterium]